MMTFHLWVNRHIDGILFASIVVVLLTFLLGCTTTPPVVLPVGEQYDYVFCKAGIGGDYRILVPTNPQELPVLALFSVGGPYDKDHVLCAVSGDHSILDLGKGKRS